MEPRSLTGLYHYAVGTLRLTFTKTRYSVVKKDSEPLQMITAEFSLLMKQFRIFFFWEEVPTDLDNRTVFVVKESSAAPLMYNTERSGIPANHEGMVRFPSSSCSSYRTVIEALKR